MPIEPAPIVVDPSGDLYVYLHPHCIVKRLQSQALMYYVCAALVTMVLGHRS